MTSKNIIVKADRSFDPFAHDHLFYEYDVDITDDQINQILWLFKYKEKGQFEQLTTFKSINVLNLPLLKSLKEKIVHILKEHNLTLDNNWAQFYNKNSSHGLHNHYGSFYSGIIYLKGDNASPTIFRNSNLTSVYTHHFKKNVLLLFPSIVFHEVEKLKNDEERLIISFNTNR